MNYRRAPHLFAGGAAALIVTLAAVSGAVQGAASPPALTCEYLSNAQFPAAMAPAPDGRVFYGELYAGSVRVIPPPSGLSAGDPTPFVTIPDVNGTLEKGLLGIALDPDWNATPWLYVYYTAKGTASDDNRIVRYWAAGPTAGASELILSGLKANISHNGGTMKFGPDGKLYVSVGEALEPDLAQSNTSLNGKILRLEKDGSIPADNPDPASAVYTLGHRNVFGMAFNPWTGVPYVTENGPSSHDEVNLLLPGRNCGWPLVLGFANDSRFEDPVWDIPVVSAPTGLVFDTSRFPTGDHLDLYYGDFNTGLIQRLVLDAPDYRNVSDAQVVIDLRANVLALERVPGGPILISSVTTIFSFDPQRSRHAAPLARLESSRQTAYVGLPVRFDAARSVDPDGDLPLRTVWNFGDGTESRELTTTHAFQAPGTYNVTLLVADACNDEADAWVEVEILDGAANLPPHAAFEASALSGTPPITLRFDAGASFDPYGGPVTWRWEFGDGGLDQGPVAWHRFSAEGNFTVRLTVTDELRATASATQVVTMLHVNGPPVPAFSADLGAVSAGSPATFDASASSDPEGAVAEAQWSFGDGKTASGLHVEHYFRQAGEYTVTLTVTDSDGAKATTSSVIRVEPRPPPDVGLETFLVLLAAVVALLALGARPRRP